MSTTLVILLVVGGLIITGLAGYAGYLLAQLYHQQQHQKHQQRIEQQQQIEQLKQHNDIVERDIRTIASATLAEQCELTECVMRIAVLSTRFATLGEPLPDFTQRYAAIFGLYDKVKHHPTHQNYAELEKQQRMKFRVERMKLEAEWHERVIADLQKLVATKSLIAA